MKLAMVGGLVLGLVTVGCSDDTGDELHDGEGGGATTEGPRSDPSVATVRIHGAVIRPWDAQLELWDDSQKVGAAEVEALASLLEQAEPYAEVIGLFGAGLIDHYAPPDPFGQAELFTAGKWQGAIELANRDTNLDNTLTPSFSLTYPDLVLADWPGIELTLQDEDDLFTGGDDPIGSVMLDRDDLLDAFHAGGVFPVPTHTQGSGAILFVTISVMDAEPGD